MKVCLILACASGLLSSKPAKDVVELFAKIAIATKLRYDR
jgi:hypothetical protein